MAISTIVTQPDPNQLMAAYQTIYIVGSGAVNANPVVYFDIYFNGVYYRTISTTTPYQRTSGSDWYRVDIADAVQEYLVSNVMDLHFSDVTSVGGSVASCFVRLRGSAMSPFLVPNGPIPVQATRFTAAVSGGGLQTNTFYVLNMALQHEDPNSAIAFLAITPYTIPTLGAIDYEYLPLTRNGSITVCLDDYGYAPFLMHTNGSASGGASVRLFVNIEGINTTYYPNGTGYHLITEDRVYYLPYGPKNLMLTPGYNNMPFYNAKRYKVGLDDSHGNVVFVTPWITVNRASDNHRRVFFRNYLGHYEAINFDGSAESLVTSSGAWQKMLEYTPPQAHKKFRGSNRFNVRSNETGVLLGSFPESMMPLLAELAGSPDVYLQWKGTNGQADDLMPILIGDGEMQTLKVEERYNYEVGLKYSYANPNIHTRN